MWLKPVTILNPESPWILQYCLGSYELGTEHSGKFGATAKWQGRDVQIGQRRHLIKTENTLSNPIYGRGVVRSNETIWPENQEPF